MTDHFRVRYDGDSDVLYITTPDYGPAYGEEDQPGVFWRYLDADGTLVGVTVLDFSAYWRPRLPSLIDEFSRHFHLPKKAAKAVLETAHG